jgi:hypothetical protein
MALGLVAGSRGPEAEVSTGFQLLLFSVDPRLIRLAVASGVAGIMVDWEQLGKATRQASADTEINRNGVDELRRVRRATEALVVCRLNGYGPWTEEEVEQAIGGGADEVLVPMVRSPREVEQVLRLVRGRCGVGILVETIEGVRRAEELGRLPLSRVYVGLNDLAIERRTPTIFAALIDGTVERVRPWFSATFGFGGLTLPELGRPIPCRLLLGEMVRLGSGFSFLRRSFHRDVAGRDPGEEVARILEAVEAARRRSPEAVARDRRDLELAILKASEPRRQLHPA